MEISTHLAGDVLVIEPPEHSLMVYTVDAFRELAKEKAAQHPRIVVDLGQVKFIDSSGFGALIATARWTGEKGGQVKLCQVSEECAILFETMRLDRLFTIYPTQAEAIQAFGPAPSSAEVNA